MQNLYQPIKVLEQIYLTCLPTKDTSICTFKILQILYMVECSHRWKCWLKFIEDWVNL